MADDDLTAQITRVLDWHAHSTWNDDRAKTICIGCDADIQGIGTSAHQAEQVLAVLDITRKTDKVSASRLPSMGIVEQSRVDREKDHG